MSDANQQDCYIYISKQIALCDVVRTRKIRERFHLIMEMLPDLEGMWTRDFR